MMLVISGHEYATSFFKVLIQTRPVASSIIGGGGGHIFIYSYSAQLVYFEIDCFYGLRTRIYEFVPPPPNYRLATGLIQTYHCLPSLSKVFGESQFTQ